MRHLLGIAGVIVVIVLGMLWPLLPGDYDPLAVPLSTLAQASGIVGLLLTPVGLLWWLSLYSATLASRRRGLLMMTLAVVAIVMSLVAFGALMTSASLGVVLTLAGLLVLVRLVRGAQRIDASRVSAGVLGSYLVLVPVGIVTVQLVLLPATIEFSRTRAIRNSRQLIADIEQYRATHGRYPVSLLSLHPDYKPSLKGIPRFHYELNGEAYNLLFEQMSGRFGTQELVVYNPRDEQQATSHAMDILEYSPEHLNRTRGYYAVHATGHPHWKVFWFD